MLSLYHSILNVLSKRGQPRLPPFDLIQSPPHTRLVEPVTFIGQGPPECCMRFYKRKESSQVGKCKSNWSCFRTRLALSIHSFVRLYYRDSRSNCCFRHGYCRPGHCRQKEHSSCLIESVDRLIVRERLSRRAQKTNHSCWRRFQFPVSPQFCSSGSCSRKPTTEKDIQTTLYPPHCMHPL